MAILAAVMLLGTGVPQPDVFAQGGSVWVDPPPLESTGKPASPTTPEVQTPAGAKASIPPVAEFDHSGSTGARWAKGVDPTCGRAPEL